MLFFFNVFIIIILIYYFNLSFLFYFKFIRFQLFIFFFLMNETLQSVCCLSYLQKNSELETLTVFKGPQTFMQTSPRQAGVQMIISDGRFQHFSPLGGSARNPLE